MPLRQANGIAMRFEVQGQGRPLLLLHGLGSCLEDWTPVVPLLTPHFQVVTCDLRGHGQSDKPPPPYSIALMATDVAALLDDLNLGPVDVAGFSLGGMVAWQLALDRPDSMRRLVVVNALADYRATTLRRRFEAWWRIGLVRLLGMKMTGRWLARRLFPKPDQIMLRRATAARLSSNDPRAYLATLRGIAAWSMADRLPEIDRPTLVIASEHDYADPAQHQANANRLPHGSFALIPHTRHAWPLEAPEAFASCLERFLGA